MFYVIFNHITIQKMKQHFIFLFILSLNLTLIGQMETSKAIELNETQATHLSKLALTCIHQEYPNKTGQVLGSEADLGGPRELHPAFYGCFDWHSAVHGHWMLIHLLKSFPKLENAEEIRTKIAANITAENMNGELAYFQRETSKSYERTYGWTWYLKLCEALYTWDDPQAREWLGHLQPLADLIIERYHDFLPKLLYPIRVGEHTNTAFGVAFAWDYATTVGNVELKQLIEKRARDYFLEDANCPITWEPSGFDFLSPCLEEADIMRRVLNAEEFATWIDGFLPNLSNDDFRMETAKVADRSDGKLVHLDGVNLSRAWCLYGLSKSSTKLAHLSVLADEHMAATLPNLVEDDYAGGHWLASFAVYALQQKQNLR